MTKHTIIPIAGGKGGIGKSLIAANLGIALASKGYKTVVVDLDLGGSNLHTCLGLPNKFPGLGDFLKAHTVRFEDLLYETHWENLKIIPGDGKTPFMANITYAQKLNLIQGIKSIDADFILLDLGAGTTYNTLDFYRTSQYGLVITTPEKHSILNMLTFLKNVVYRSIDRVLIKKWDAREIFHQACSRPIEQPQITLQELTEKINQIDAETAELVKGICNHYRPRLILNMANHPNELKSLIEANNACKNILSVDCDFFGFIFQDENIRDSFIKGVPFITTYPDSTATKNIHQLANDIEKWWHKTLKNTDQWLMKQTTHFFENNPR
ncbi:MAG: P-loop NTPase [Deltaproteobacteria bacterium]|nr:P-loop NTPase [Deltaproteobacteria bacterium]